MILGILQARMSSRRLPGKVLLPLAGAPMLARHLERLQRVTRMDALLVATSDRAEDAPVADLAAASGALCYRGSLDDVLDRFYQAAAPLQPSHVVRLTGDCPLADWEVIDACIAFALDGGYDYASNTLRPTWPDGLDVEVATFAALAAAWREADTPLQREHVMPFITAQPDRFRLGSMVNGTDLSGLRWTVDEPADYQFASRVYDALYPGNPAFRTPEILALVARDGTLASLNEGIARNAGLLQAGAPDTP